MVMMGKHFSARAHVNVWPLYSAPLSLLKVKVHTPNAISH